MNVATISIAYLENTGLERNYADRKKTVKPISARVEKNSQNQR